MIPEEKCGKIKKEVYTLLMNPEKIEGSRGVIITKEQMALFRINGLFENLYSRLKKECPTRLGEMGVSKATIKRNAGLTTPKLIEMAKTLLTLEEKQRIFENQQEQEQARSIGIPEYPMGTPEYLFLKEEEISQKPENQCSLINELIDITGEEFLDKHGSKLKKRKKRKPSKRNLFIGEKMRGKTLTMQEASDLWKNMSETEREAFRID